MAKQDGYRKADEICRRVKKQIGALMDELQDADQLVGMEGDEYSLTLFDHVNLSLQEARGKLDRLHYRLLDEM